MPQPVTNGMKKTDFEKLKNRTSAELVRDLAETKEKLWTLKHEIENGKQKNVRSAAALRRDIARMGTLIEIKNQESENKK